MATNLAERIEELARRIATDQVAQDIDNNSKFLKSADFADYEARISALEAKLNELIAVAWTEEEVEQLTTTTEE